MTIFPCLFSFIFIAFQVLTPYISVYPSLLPSSTSLLSLLPLVFIALILTVFFPPFSPPALVEIDAATGGQLCN